MTKHLHPKPRLLALIIALFCGIQIGWAYSFSASCSTGQTLYYTITDSNNHYVSVVAPGGNSSSGWNNYSKPTGTMDIPATVVSNNITYTITAIETYAFYGCSELTEVTIPEGVTTVGGYAFWNCPGIETVHFNATNCTSMVTSSAYSVFNRGTTTSEQSNIKTITIGDNVTCIPDYAFRNAQQLNGLLSVPASVVSIGNYAFYNCVSLNFLNLEEGLVTIGNFAFYYCQVLEGRFQTPRGLYLPNSVTTVGGSAFFHCVTLPLLSIGEGVTSIGACAFWECSSMQTVYFNAINCNSMKSIVSSSSYSVFGKLHTDSSNYPPIVNLTIGSGVTRIPDYAFSECSRITGNLSLPNTLIYIGDYAFNWCSGYSGSLTIPNAVTSIGNYAFNNCSGFTSLGIGSSVATIGNYAFNECTEISGAVTVPNATTTIGDHAFYHCSSISTLTLGTGVETIGGYAFWYCPSLTTVHFNPTNCTQMYTVIGSNTNFFSVFNIDNTTNTVQQKTPIVTLTIGSNVTRIPDYAFRNSTNMTSTITIPNATTYVGQYSFYGAKSAELTIGTGVDTIGGYAFWNCPNMATVHFNATNCTSMVTNSSNAVFSKGTSASSTPIVTLTIGSNVTRIPDYAFRRSSDMTSSVIIPDACTYLGIYSFAQCSGHNIFTGNNVTVIQHDTFYGSGGFDGTITLGPSVTAINNYAFYNCSGLNGGLEFPETLLTIGSYAFYACSGLTGNLVFPDSLTTINQYAFYGCSGFDGDLVIPNSVTTLDNNAFQNSTGFDGSLVLGAGLTGVSSYTFDGCNGFANALILGVNIVSVGSYSFQNCSGFSSFITTHTPSIGAQANSFNGMNYSIPLYIPYNQSLNYQNKDGWKNFTNYVSQCPFVGYVDNLWSTANNWGTGYVPTSTDVVCINDASCQLDIDAQVRYLYVMNIAKALTVSSGKSLVSTIGAGTLQPSQLVVEDGGSLYNPISNTYGTIKKNIAAYSGTSGWYTLSTPIHSGTETSFFSSGTYDLYYYDEPAHYWRNKEKSSNNFVKLQPAQGCLYAHSTAQTLSFVGEINASNKVFEVPITHDGGPLAGYNLIGNPYTHNLYISDVKINGASQSSYYKIVNGSNLVAYTSNDPIGPCEGFMVVAPNAGTLTFTHSRERSVEPMLRLVLSQGGTDTETVEEDRAYLRMGMGETLDKMTLSGVQSLLYFRQDDASLAVAEAHNETELLCLEVFNSGNYTIEATLLNTTPEYLHLIDMQTGDDIDLLTMPRYSFEALPSDNPCRFALAFSPDASLPEKEEGDRGRGFQLPSHGSTTDQNAYFNENCTITVSANPTAGGTVTGGGTYQIGTSCTISATANTGYTFTKWTRNGTQVSTNATYTFTVTGAATYVAVFTPISYTISASASPANGGTVSGAGTYNYGTSCTLTATPATGYSFSKWTKNGTQVSTNASYTFTVTGAETYVAVFTKNSYSITATASPTAGGTVSGAGTYEYGSSCTLTATANTGYTFSKWTKNGTQVSDNATYTFTVTGAGSYVAVFTPNSYTISASANPSNGGTVSGAGNYNYGTTCTLTATPATGYSFSKWTKNGTQVSTNATYSFTVSGNATYVAVFTKNSYSITATASPTAGGTISGAGTYEYGSSCTLTATPATGYTFTRWVKDGIQVSTNATYTFNVYGSASYTAVFTINQYTISALASPTDGGTVSGGGTFDHGSSCTLTATPSTDYSFYNWTENGTVVSTDASYSFTVTASRTLVANFISSSISQHTQSMAAGWNWWSTYIELSSVDGLTMLEEALFHNGLSIVSQNYSTQNYYPSLGYDYWFGSLQSLQNESGYKVKTSGACNVTMIGETADPSNHPITIQPNWNWIGYPSSVQQLLATAMANYTPSQEDVIKNQNASATYYEGYGWFPEDYVLVPGQCYMYKSNASGTKTLTFVNGKAVEDMPEEQRHWNNDVHAFADNMSVIAVVVIDGEEHHAGNLELGAFVDGESRGSAVLQYFAPTGRYYAVLTIMGEEGEPLDFGLVDRGTDDVFQSHSHLVFHSNDVVGSLDHPLEVAFGGLTGTVESSIGRMWLYPNPIERNASFALELPENEETAQVMIVNSVGEVVWRKTGSVAPTNMPGLAVEGVYVVKVVCRSGNIYFGKLIVK